MFLTCSSVIATTMVVGLPSQLLSTSSNLISGVNSQAMILNSGTLSSPIRKVTGKSSEMSSTNTFLPGLHVSERVHLHFLILSLELPTLACQELANSGIGHRYFEHVFNFQDQRLSRPLYCYTFSSNNSMSVALLVARALPLKAIIGKLAFLIVFFVLGGVYGGS